MDLVQKNDEWALCSLLLQLRYILEHHIGKQEEGVRKNGTQLGIVPGEEQWTGTVEFSESRVDVHPCFTK